MATDLRDIERRADAQLAVHERLALSALVVVVSLWIRVAEVIPDIRRP